MPWKICFISWSTMQDALLTCFLIKSKKSVDQDLVSAFQQFSLTCSNHMKIFTNASQKSEPENLPQILIGASSSRNTGYSMKISLVSLHSRETSFSLILTFLPPDWTKILITSSMFSLLASFAILLTLFGNINILYNQQSLNYLLNHQ